MSTKIIVEVGSTHNGKMAYIEEAIDRSIEMGADAVKFQLFPNEERFTKSGNVWLAPDLYLEAVEYSKGAIEVSASVFDEDSFEFLLKTDPPFVKFAFSQKNQRAWIEEALHQGREAIVSCDVMTERDVPFGARKLFCIAEYPVLYQVRFDGIFPRFDGFSDHSLGIDLSIDAVSSGAQIIEKHMTLTYPDITCPDAQFALEPAEFATMIAHIRRFEKG